MCVLELTAPLVHFCHCLLLQRRRLLLAYHLFLGHRVDLLQLDALETDLLDGWMEV